MPGTIKMFCIRMNILSQRNNIVLFLACNMAAMQNLYCINWRAHGEDSAVACFSPPCKRISFILSSVGEQADRQFMAKFGY